ncbi:ALD3 (YMR169C) [Zygosaccharomyces parabailii]|uniref:BN860_03642g1_1 n=1 Tax=Zygosaccharomyces bailii (strain CLIB 213 / ATCC 58445 / CBS 680 / BCRC 21525 / NBRC 1098 / NCYC 1416 / NRRL Y-2227) TaxID=1333698 RepID=A0A8J2X7Y0_ZYGB2|nr:ALD3 (YMR169C) [Zygosaccharomyces parabailii]CDF87316.1 BN860_03642g1_1 [Zygosaccharomyces bailii CLIB 213]CDH15617.1 probable Aldehyde dehydrogenase [NAD(P)+] 1 [Zygosaccharomyces bailii ISA1307]
MFTSINIPQLGIRYEQPVGLFINNKFVKSKNGSQIDTINPSTGEKTASFYAAGAADVDDAVKAAKHAYDEVWSKTSPSERSDLLWKLVELIERDKKLLAALETLDSGKPYHSNALGDLEQIISVTKYYAGAAGKIGLGKQIPISQDKYAVTFQVPYGVVGQVVPWNYPLAMASWKMQGCLAAGNTIVIKPAENTSLSLLYFAQLLVEAGFPPGVVNVVPGHGGEAGTALASHPNVDKVAFTGSTNVGKLVMECAGKSNLKPVTLECGGKSPAVVFEDAKIENAVEWCAMGIFYNSGQNCTANSRIYVQESIYEKFLEAFKSHATKTWKFGAKRDPFDEDCTVGPVISESQYKRIKGYIEHGVKEEGLQVETIHELPPDSKGYFIQPTFFTNVPQNSKLNREEIFGPVAVISTFKDEDEAIKLANDTDYGLASAVFTQDIGIATRFVRDIKAGTVWVNSSNDEDISVPFGGFKMSGIGRELGEAGMETYLQTKSAHFNITV